MKHLTLIRHAKSSWEYNLDDFYRPLKETSIDDIALVCKNLKNNFLYPDAVFSSPAKRALTTCNLFLEHLKINKNLLKTNQDLYDFGGDKVLHFIKQINNDIDNVILFGHNHAFTELSNKLSNLKIDNLPTSGVVVIKFDIEDWNDVGNGKVLQVLYPRLFK